MTQLDNSVVPEWNEEPSTLDAFEERVILYVLGPRLLAQMDPERQPYEVVKSAVTTTQLAAEGGATLVIAALRRALGARPIQEVVRLFRQLMGLCDMRRQPGESMRKWTSRFEAFIKKTGKAHHQADAEIEETTFLHPLIQGILLLECSNLSPAENVAVLATSGATTKEGGSIGNSYLHVDLAANFIAQWDDEALMRRDSKETYASHCRCSNNDVGFVFTVERFFWNKTLWMVVSGKRYSAPTMSLGRTRAGKSLKRPKFWTTTGPMSFHQKTQNWKINLTPRSSGGPCSDGTQECFVGHEKRHTNMHGGQGSGFSSKTRKRSLPSGRCGCFRWFSNDNAERITTDWRWER